MNHIQDFLARLEQMSDKQAGGPPTDRSHHTIMGWIAEHGQPFTPEPLTDDELAWLFDLLDIEGSRYQIKECYYNSQKVLLFADTHGFLDGDHELVYAEGYAESIIPVHHGWLLLNGKVVDLTMRLREPLNRTSRVHRRRLRNRVLGEFPTTRSYFGVPFETNSVRAFLRRTHTLGSLIDDWQSGFPIFEPESHHYPRPLENYPRGGDA